MVNSGRSNDEAVESIGSGPAVNSGRSNDEANNRDGEASNSGTNSIPFFIFVEWSLDYELLLRNLI